MNAAGEGGRLSHRERRETGQSPGLISGWVAPRKLIASLAGLCFSLKWSALQCARRRKRGDKVGGQ